MSVAAGPLLRAEGLRKRFGAITALEGVDLSLAGGEICGLIGPNGSGKTTLFDCCTGLLRAEEGRVYLASEEITGWPPHRIARVGGMVRSFQRVSVFGSMTVEENLLAAGQARAFPNTASTFLRGPRSRARSAAIRRRAADLLALLELSHAREALTNALSYGQQKLVQFASALLVQPRLALLDEPFAGVNPVLIERMANTIRWANRELGTTFLIIEHNIDELARLCPRIAVLHQGAKIADGPPGAILADTRVVEAYLGG